MLRMESMEFAMYALFPRPGLFRSAMRLLADAGRYRCAPPIKCLYWRVPVCLPLGVCGMALIWLLNKLLSPPQPVMASPAPDPMGTPTLPPARRSGLWIVQIVVVPPA